MKTVEIKLYKFNELSEDAKKKAIQSHYDINVNFEWWEFTYEDAKNIGLKIKSFDIDRGSYCEGEFIEDACNTAYKILSEHGEVCESYKTAKNFLKERDELIDSAPKNEDGDFEDEYELDSQLDELENDFLENILEDYRILLQQEYEYQTSEEAIIETIEANEYDFTEDGEMY